ncbi:MAG: polysaccharide biosynthesis C-terminal domain-containing protein [Syntrophobacteraceae bacterium]|jgi:O-antigen/teichoic acid export membrane protein
MLTEREKPQRSQVLSRRSLLKNSSGILLGRIIAITVALISVPIVVDRLDVVGYGTWESIIAVSTISNIFQSTISGTLLWKISGAYGADDLDSVRQYLGVGILFSLLGFFIVTPLAWVGRDLLIHLFQVPEQFRRTASIVLPCVVGLMTLGSVNEVIAALIAGFQESGISAFIHASSMTCNSLAVIACLFLGFEFWSLLIGFAVGFITYGVGLYARARHIFSSFSLVPLLPRKAILQGTMSYAGFMLLGAVSIALRDQTDKIVLSSAASPVLTGYFSIAARLSSVLLVICSFVYVPTIAAAAAMHSRSDWPGLQRLYTDVMTVLALTVGLSIALISALYDRLIILWVGRSIPEVGTMLYFLVAGTAVAVLVTGTGSSVCKGIGIIWLETIYILVGLILNLILKVTLVLWIGAIGTVISSATSWAIASVVFIVLLHKNTQLPVTGTIRGIKGLLLGAACAFCGRWLSHQIPLESSRFSALVSTVELATIITVLFLTAMVLFRGLSISAIATGARFIRTTFSGMTSRL